MLGKLASGAAILLGGTFLASAANAQTTPSPCPTFANTQSSGCGAIVTVTQSGAAVMQQPGVGPYDGSDDTLIGVVNNIPACTSAKSQSVCGLSIYSLDLTSTKNIFGFDGDGIDNYGASSNSADSTRYGGPNAYFTNYNSQTSGRVNFIMPIPPGGTAYFSLENMLSSSTACTNAINKSLCDANGNNCGGGAPNVPTIIVNPNDSPPGRLTAIKTTFIPQGINPNTNQKYTLVAAAQVCGFIGFDWQQTITQLPTPLPDSSFNAIATPNTPPATPFNDPPPSGYLYMQPAAYQAKYGLDAPGINVYWDPNNATTAKGFALSAHTTTTVLDHFDAPADPCLPGMQSTTPTPDLPNGLQAAADSVCGPLAQGAPPHSNRAPAGSAINFRTHLVGLQGLLPGAVPVDTGMGFTWTSNNNGTIGGTASMATPPSAPNDLGGTGGVTVTSVSQTSTYTGVGVTAINGSNNIFSPTSSVAAVLPASRSVQVGGTATAFATIINTGSNTATSCSIAPASSLPLVFHYRTTDPSTNQVSGTLDTPVDIAAGQSQTFVIGLTPSAAIAPTNLGLTFTCSNTAPAPVNVGIDTLLLSAATSPTSDVVALAATAQNDGILHLPGASGASSFTVATVNLGASGAITATATTPAGVTLPLAVTLCQTDPATSQCLAPAAASANTTINANTTPTFGIFATASGAIPFDPVNNRIFVQFSDSTGAIRGETSVAVETQ